MVLKCNITVFGWHFLITVECETYSSMCRVRHLQRLCNRTGVTETLWTPLDTSGHLFLCQRLFSKYSFSSLPWSGKVIVLHPSWCLKVWFIFLSPVYSPVAAWWSVWRPTCSDRRRRRWVSSAEGNWHQTHAGWLTAPAEWTVQINISCWSLESFSVTAHIHFIFSHSYLICRITSNRTIRRMKV